MPVGRRVLRLEILDGERSSVVQGEAMPQKFGTGPIKERVE